MFFDIIKLKLFKYFTLNTYVHISAEFSFFKMSKKEKTFPFLLSHGIPVDSSIYELIQKITPKNLPHFQNVHFDFIWFLGQFVKYTMRLGPKFEEQLQIWKREANFNHSPIVG
jgi:hypothetical protein